jgi:hypothetical protein
MEFIIVIGVLYVAVLGLFRLLGGLYGAADAFQSWGRATTSLDGDRFSPSS